MKNKNKRPSIHEDKKPPLESLDEVLKRENIFYSGLDGILSSTNKFETILNIVEEHQIQKEKDEEWNHYLLCDGVPRSLNPLEFRKFLSKWEYYENESEQRRISWHLIVDERSILTQDMDAPNLTKKFTKPERMKFVKTYQEQIEKMLKVYAILKEGLAKSVIGSQSQRNELLQLKEDISNSIQNALDIITVRVIRTPSLYMNDLDSRTAEYGYKCDTFQIHIWGFKNVPIIFNAAIAQKDVNLHSIQVKMTLPFLILQENLTLRGIHLAYDNYSEFVETYNLPSAQLQEEDLKTTLVKEWAVKKWLRKDKLEKLIQQSDEYKEWLQEENAKSKENTRRRSSSQPKNKGKRKRLSMLSAGEKGGKLKNIPEPILVPENMVPKIKNEFDEFQENKHQFFLSSISPEVFNLEEGEINLREYMLLGGIYEFNFVKKPHTVHYPEMVLTSITYPLKLHYKYKNCQMKADPNDLIPKIEETSKTMRRVISQSSEETFYLKRNEQEEVPLNFYKITFKIPEEISKWSQPIVCQWFDADDEFTKNASWPTLPKKPKNKITPVIVKDFLLLPKLTQEHFYHLINYITPSLPSNMRIVGEVSSDTIRTMRRQALNRSSTRRFQSEDLVHPVIPPETLYPTRESIRPIIIVPTEDTPTTEETKYANIKTFSQYLNEITEAVKAKYPVFKESPPEPPQPKERCMTAAAQSLRTIFTPPPSKHHFDARRNPSKFKRRRELNTSRLSLRSYTHKTTKSHFNHSIQNETKSTNITRIEEPTENKPNIEKKEERKTVNENIECPDTGYKYPKWSTKNIFKSEFNKEKLEMTIWTNRLGVFSFAYKKYTHLPFDDWFLCPDPNDYTKIRFNIATGNLVFMFEITQDGYWVKVTDYKLEKGKQIVYYKMEDITIDLDSLKKKLQQNDLNVFPERDAVIYVRKALEKHLALEFHTYNCMADMCMFMNFGKSVWNRVTNRREIIMKCGKKQEELLDLEHVQITTEQCKFVRIHELCTDLNIVKLQYEHIRHDAKINPDLLALLRSIYFREMKKHEGIMQDPKLQYNVMSFLKAVRPLSFAY